MSPTKPTTWSTKQPPSAQHALTVRVSPAPPLSAGRGLYTSAGKGRQAPEGLVSGLLQSTQVL